MFLKMTYFNEWMEVVIIFMFVNHDKENLNLKMINKKMNLI